MKLLRIRFLLLFAVLLAGGILLLSQCRVALADQQSSMVTTPILGIQGDGQTHYPGIGWQRLAYQTCGNSNLSGQVLQDTISNYHRQGISVLMVSDRKSTRLNSSHQIISYAVFCLKKKNNYNLIYYRL